MKRWILILAGLALALAASAQENILDRLKAANTYETLQASFVQTRHSSMLTKDLKSEGRMVLASPDRIRWEVLKPYPSVFVSSGELAIAGRRFRMPTEKDFTATALEGEDLAVKLVPVRRDLKSLFREIIVHGNHRPCRQAVPPDPIRPPHLAGRRLDAAGVQGLRREPARGCQTL